MLKILSLGAGVQSTTLLLMSIRGELPRLDAAIFADTGWEPQAVYDHLAWLTTEAEQAGIPVYRVSDGNLREDTLKSSVNGDKDRMRVILPVFTENRATAVRGNLRRMCTVDYKIKPVRRKIKALAGLSKHAQFPKEPIAGQWIGISTDELQRAKRPDVNWLDHEFPLITEKRFSRADCLAWLATHYPDIQVPRSSCIGCPFHSDAEWQALTPAELEDACQFDEAIRDSGGLHGRIYLHRNCIPLREARFSDETQGDWIEDCMGMCNT